MRNKTPLHQQTIVNHDIGRPVRGYVVTASPSIKIQKKIAGLQVQLGKEFGDLIWNTPPHTLHITLMDWLAPLVDYQKDKEALFKELFPSCNDALELILGDYRPITIHFTEVKATPGAIIITGHDSGEFNDIRRRFLEKIQLQPGTKQPPAIIHSTIARYQKETSLEPIVEFLAQHPLAFTHTVDRFYLTQENIAPQLEHTVLKEYSLS